MIIIVGGGLSGLLIAYRLKGRGIPFKILEARDRIGGRIHTISYQESAPIEMGATWFSDQHVHLKKLLKELNINFFEQFMEGTSFFQPFTTSPANAIPIPSQPPSFRIAGGTSSIIKILANLIGHDDILLNEEVGQIDFTKEHVNVMTNKVYQASKVILALPPKLWANNINFIPMLDLDLMDIAMNTHTWMEESTKVALTYEIPFWRKNGHSGALFSNSGPITEFYDHCNSEVSKYALCGFLNPSYAKLDFDQRKKLVLEQAVLVFGDEAKDFTNYKELIWSKEDKTFTENSEPLFPHQNNGSPIFRNTYYDSRLIITSSEASKSYAGYMEGAVVSANFVVDQIIGANKV